MAPGGMTRLHPEYIKFTQDSIKAQFMDGRELSSTLEDLLYGRKTVDDIPPIEVVEDLEDCGWWALTGNRRLYLYRKLEQLGVVETIPVIEVAIWDYGVSDRLNQRRTTFCDGRDIRLRGSQGEWRINQIIDRWRVLRPFATNRNKQTVTNSIHANPIITSPTPKIESEMSVNSQKEVPPEQSTSNRSTAESEEGVTYVIDEGQEVDEQTAITYQPLRERSYTRIYPADDDDCCSCCSCTCCSWCCCSCC